MKFKEAIEFCKLEGSYCPQHYMRQNYYNIINLLEQGEKYRLILKALDKNYGHYLIGVKGNGEIGEGYTIRDFIEKVKEKYFPKEETDANNNR